MHMLMVMSQVHAWQLHSCLFRVAHSALSALSTEAVAQVTLEAISMVHISDIELAGPVTNRKEKTFVKVVSMSIIKELVALYNGIQRELKLQNCVIFLSPEAFE